MGYPTRFVPRNAFDFVTTITTSIVPYPTTPVRNLQNPRRGRICRWPAASGAQTMTVSWGGQGWQVGFIGLDRHNLSPAALWRFRGYSLDNLGGVVLCDTNAIPPYNAAALGSFTWGKDPLGTGILDGYQGYKYSAAWFPKVTIASGLLEIFDPTNSDQVVDLSRIILGDYIETAFSPSFGVGAGWRERTEQSENDGGSKFSNAKIPRRGLRGTLQFLSATERQAMFDMIRYVGMRMPFAVSLQSGEGASFERDFTILQAKFVELDDLRWDRATDHSFNFALEEA